MSEQKKEGILAKKSEDFDEWYTQIILRSEIADYSPVSGCMVFRPSGYSIWESIQAATDAEFKRVGILNSYFPLFIPERLLKKEAEHVEGFSPEVAWVTQTGNSQLEERLAIRPTSETIMYEVVKKWIRSWRDLPLRLNQWNNVVRWEFKHPVPFLRSREFLWNEGHTLFATKKEAEAEGDEILGIYRMVTEEYMALPGLMGRKTDSEKFAGAEATYSIEHLLPDGKAIQGPDFHFDGQRFSKAFEITFVDEEGQSQFAWQNTWAISTREIGILLAVHSDDKGAVVPPKLAWIQVVVVPIVNDETKKPVLEEATSLAKRLSAKFRTKLDARDHLTPGRKFNEWELKGVPLRVELGPRDLKEHQVVLVRRDTGTKRTVKADEAEAQVEKELEEIQESLFQKATEALAKNTHEAKTLEELKEIISSKGGIVRIPWCGKSSCEKMMKEKAGGKILNIPLGQKSPKVMCPSCGEQAEMIVNYGKSY
ncbi:MAG: proline--tRNA ligase [Thaumarchaeota archaeon]|nr:proline--tRNA ligase [Nitrososphaerota archaeon]